MLHWVSFIIALPVARGTAVVGSYMLRASVHRILDFAIDVAPESTTVISMRDRGTNDISMIVTLGFHLVSHQSNIRLIAANVQVTASLTGATVTRSFSGSSL